MLHSSRSYDVANEQQRDEESRQLIDLSWVLAAARRQAWIIALGPIVGILFGALYILGAVPLYTASADIFIDKGRSQLINQYELSNGTDAIQDETEILSQVEVIKSEQIARAVVAKLKLTENADFMAGIPDPVRYVLRTPGRLIDLVAWLVTPASDESDGGSYDATAEAADMLRDGVSVERTGRTYVLNVSYTATTPELAKEIAQGYGDAYLDDQLQSKYEATRRASVWLQDRIAELKQQSFEADLKVQTFRTENNLISAGGQLVSEQQLSEINTQLVTSQASTAEAKARLDQIDALIKSGHTDAVVNQSLQSATINSLRERYLDASRLKSEIEGKLGPKHVQVVRLGEQMSELQRLIFEELRRIAESYRSDYNVALSRQKSLQDSMANIVGVNADANTTQVRLRELERESATFKLLYDTFLQKYQETVQQQSFPISNARIITPAAYPSGPSYPRKSVVLVIGMLLGTVASSALGGLREYRERFFRTGDQVRTEAKVEFLGFTPFIEPKPPQDREPPEQPLPGDGLWKPGSIGAHVRTQPMSSFAETLRNVKVAADATLPQGEGKVIGVVSCLPAEGKSTIASNLSVLFAMQGARVVLIDGDLRNPGLTRSLAVKPTAGLIEALADPEQRQIPILHDRSGRLDVLPTIHRRRVANTSELLVSPRMARLLNHLRTQYDYIIIDLPPVGPVVDAKAFAHRVNAFLFVVEWGKTSRQLVQRVLVNTPTFYEKCLGIILNKSDEFRILLYESAASLDYYSSRYTSYYRDSDEA